jgi:hypothetical protein
MRLAMTTTFALCAFCRLATAAPALPADPRLAPVRARVDQLVTHAEQAGLPAEIIVSKVREGLAKGVDPQRIAVAAERLVDNLTEARAFVAERRGQGAAAPELVRAVAEARMAGIAAGANDAIVREARSSGDGARAVEVLTDLSLRGYPVDRATQMVRDVLKGDAAAVPRLPATLETIRQEQALTQVESMDALTRGMAKGGGSLKAAAAQAASAGHRPEGVGRGNGKAGEGGVGPGNAGFVPPGQLKKETGAMKATGVGNGKGMGMGMGQGQGHTK